MILTTEEVLSLAAGELLELRRKPQLTRLRCRPKLPQPKPEPIKITHAVESAMLSQTSALLGWLEQVMPPTSLAVPSKREDADRIRSL